MNKIVKSIAIGLASLSVIGGLSSQPVFAESKTTALKNELKKKNNIWYLNRIKLFNSGYCLNKLITGTNAFHFTKNHVTVYSVNKRYKTYNQAKKAKSLKHGDTFSTKFQKQDSVITMELTRKGKNHYYYFRNPSYNTSGKFNGYHIRYNGVGEVFAK